ncbi:hypothetical protein CEXT_41751 [Caerostris extrusa]|uniref:Uncharacterized protein n=1 Tax=Caerostris extrusa TaxID=172846 RepID=A0AAV4NU21_CAEEX|nr:hypothetical protein CEXT_41751 [Caerostris extrusa]
MSHLRRSFLSHSFRSPNPHSEWHMFTHESPNHCSIHRFPHLWRLSVSPSSGWVVTELVQQLAFAFVCPVEEFAFRSLNELGLAK